MDGRWAALLLLALAASAPGASARRVKDYKAALSTKWLSNSELAAWIDDYVARCGAIAQKINLGKSVRGRTIWALEISDKPGVDEAEPNFKYIANMHGDEISGRAVLPLFAEWLCDNHAAGDPRAGQIVRDMHVFLVPTMNPDGYPSRRENRGRRPGGFDLNRNFPDHWRDAGKDPTQPNVTPDPTQPEVEAMMKFLMSRNFVMGANFHEGSMVANYPWDGYQDWKRQNGGTVNACPDNAAFQRLAQAYSLANKAMAVYPEFKRQNGTTNGAAWYPIYGGMQDWDYVVAGAMHITLEISEQKRPPKTAIPRIWSENQEALIALPLASLVGVRGTVTSAAGAPLEATLYIKPLTTGSPYVAFKSSKNTGFYARPLLPGENFTLVASAPGFQTQEATFTVPADGSAWVQPFALVPA